MVSYLQCVPRGHSSTISPSHAYKYQYFDDPEAGKLEGDDSVEIVDINCCKLGEKIKSQKRRKLPHSTAAAKVK